MPLVLGGTGYYRQDMSWTTWFVYNLQGELRYGLVARNCWNPPHWQEPNSSNQQGAGKLSSSNITFSHLHPYISDHLRRTGTRRAWLRVPQCSEGRAELYFLRDWLWSTSCPPTVLGHAGWQVSAKKAQKFQGEEHFVRSIGSIKTSSMLYSYSLVTLGRMAAPNRMNFRKSSKGKGGGGHFQSTHFITDFGP